MILREGRFVTSYSQIDKFLKCPYSWAMKYPFGISLDIKSKALEYGLAVHEQYEYILEAVRNPESIGVVTDENKQVKYKELLSLIDEQLDSNPLSFENVKKMFLENIEARNIPFDSEEDKETHIDLALSNLKSFLNVENEYHDIMLNSEILGVEMPFEVPIDISDVTVRDDVTGEEITLDTVTIIGFIDLVVRTENGIVMFDHKSSKKKFDKAKLRSDLQFPIYSIAIKMAYGEYPIKGVYNFTKLNIFQESLYTEAITPELEAIMNKRGAKEIYFLPHLDSEREIRKTFIEMQKNNYKTCPTPLCYWCDYGYHNAGLCLASSNWQPKEKQEAA